MKASNGRWFTYVNQDVWWWGADDWSTALCKKAAPTRHLWLATFHCDVRGLAPCKQATLRPLIDAL